MDVQEGFIVGIYNYCDRWCETCAFTSRCRGFADHAELEAEHDPHLKPVTEAPPLPQDIPPPPPRWMQELIDEMNKLAQEPITDDEYEQARPSIAPEHKSIETRAHAYSDSVHAWLEARDSGSRHQPTDPRAVVGWFQYSIPAKIHRALSGLAYHEADERDWPADHDGSAKVALLGIERSHAAWLELVHLELASASEIEPFIAHLIWLSDELERVFPKARAFVRPGFDEPDAVARLLASEGGQL
jgi:hypothetical protein